VMLIDFEVGHYGDPAFDLGFFLTHLVLKSIWAGAQREAYLQIATDFWHSYRAALASSVTDAELVSLEQRMIWNLAGCLLARVDGKSPVEYLSQEQQVCVRDLARGWIVNPPPRWDRAVALSTRY
jgi:5-methylthioribose kinase